MNYETLGLQCASLQAAVFAKKYKLSYDDLYSLCLLALGDILPKIKPDGNPKSFINLSLKGYLLNHFRSNYTSLHVERSYTNLYMQIANLKRLSPTATMEQISAELNKPLDECIKADNIMRIRYVALDDENKSERYAIADSTDDACLDYLQGLSDFQKGIMMDYFTSSYTPEELEAKWSKWAISYEDIKTFSENQKAYLQELSLI